MGSFMPKTDTYFIALSLCIARLLMKVNYVGFIWVPFGFCKLRPIFEPQELSSQS
jgi:hypothetical protein